MRVIVSHDGDHLFARDHWFRDVVYPKMWVRTSLELLEGRISSGEWWRRCLSCFRRERHNLEALMDFDEAHGIQSTFFFGMSQGLGMSYRPEEAAPVIRRVHERGFAVGVHGIAYQDEVRMKQEYDTFRQVTGLEPCGIRMHYVRFDSNTFDKLATVGYAFDTTEFDKQSAGTRKDPYKVGKMWEFPLAIMDGYLLGKLDQKQEETLRFLRECKEKQLKYITILFHDYYFCEDHPDLRNWYLWLVDYLKQSNEYEFSSFEKGIRELMVLEM